MDNPFDYGHALPPDRLVDRVKEVAEIRRALLGGGKLFLIGPRRYGKTSILKAAEAKAKNAGAVVIRHDAEAYPGLDSLVQAIMLSAARQLKGPAAKVGGMLRKAFERLKPELTYDPMLQRWSTGVGFSPDMPSGHIPLLIDVLNGLAELAKESGRKTALILDEFQKVIALGGESAEGQIRAAVQHHDNVSYVFAGSKTAVLNDMTLNPSRPFYRLGSRLFLREIPRDEFVPFITRGFTSARIAVDADAIQAIFDQAEDVPYNVQALAHSAWDMAHNERARLTVNLVDRALADLVSRDDPFYTQTWNTLTPTQQRALLAAAREKGSGLQSREITQRYAVTPAAMRSALVALEGRDILRREESIGDVRWRLEDPFFRVWLASVVPIPN
jgi:AAA+ ATPase superfamily predicted ATPase